MSDVTSIEWTNATWNPWRGCDKVSPGCAHCYMFAGQRRGGLDPSVVVRTSPAVFNGPLNVRKYAPGSMVFTCSWSDWFHEDADAHREEAWAIVRARPDLTFQILTKRPERIAAHLPADWGDGYPNVWLGVSIENRRFVHRADLLRAVPAAVRFISAEPLLGPLLRDADHMIDAEHQEFALGDAPWDAWRPWADGYGGPALNLEAIDWLIVGGESGPGHRRLNPEWVRALRDFCAQEVWQDADGQTAFFLKQWGGTRPGGEALLDGVEHRAFPAREVVR